MTDESEYYLSVLDNLTGGFLTVDLKGIVVYINPTAGRILRLADIAALIGKPFALALAGATVDLEHQDVVRPAVLHRLPGVPEPFGGVVELLQEGDVVIPGNLCKRLLDNCPPPATPRQTRACT